MHNIFENKIFKFRYFSFSRIKMVEKKEILNVEDTEGLLKSLSIEYKKYEHVKCDTVAELLVNVKLD